MVIANSSLFHVIYLLPVTDKNERNLSNVTTIGKVNNSAIVENIYLANIAGYMTG